MATLIQHAALNTAMVESETDPFTEDRYRQFSRLLPDAPITVLDVGCATGRGGLALKAERLKARLVGLDCVQARLDQLPSAYEGKGVCSLTTNIDAADRSYDAIVAGEFIEHVTYSDAITTIAEFHRILKPGGQLLMTTPYPDYIRKLIDGTLTTGGAHLSAHYPKQLALMMENAGFRGVKWKPSGRMTRYLGERFPMPFYGSFLIYGLA